MPRRLFCDVDTCSYICVCLYVHVYMTLCMFVFIRSTSNYHSDSDVGTQKHVFMFSQSSWCTHVIFNTCNNNKIAVPLKVISLQPSFSIHSITECMLDLCMYLRTCTYIPSHPLIQTPLLLADNGHHLVLGISHKTCIQLMPVPTL